jgi:hypothetical protein
LLESDLALTLHFDTLETRLAFRSRIFEYIRADLPVIATIGDATAELITDYGLGRCVAFEADDQVATAILELLESPRSHFASAFEQARALLTWERAAEPLIRYCQAPWRAADKLSMSDQLEPPTRWNGAAQTDEQAEQYAALVADHQKQAELIAAYERGYFVRMMRKVAEFKHTLFGFRG